MSTITDNDRRIQYTTTGGESSFAYDFQIDDADHVAVYRDGALQVRGTHYSVTNVGDSNGGDIVPDSSLTIAADEVWTIEGDTPEDRSNDYSGFTTVKPATVDADLDRMIFMLQQMRRDADRSVRLSVDDDTNGSDMRIPLLNERSNKTLGFDENGEATVYDFNINPPDDEEPESITVLQSINTSSLASGAVVYLRGRSSVGDGGEGHFRWDSSDLSTEVGNDEVTAGEGDGGIYVAPDSDKTGASGAWVRQYSSYINVRWYGAKGDGSNDDAGAIQAAMDRMGNDGGTVIVAGEHILSSTITVPQNVQLQGVGAGRIMQSDTIVDGASQLIGDHTDGPVVRAKGRFGVAVRDIVISASDARASAAYDSSLIGLQVEAEDASDGSGKWWAHEYHRLRITRQPGHGLVMVGGGFTSIVSMCGADNNKGHGFAADQGWLTGRTNLASTGGIEFNEIRAFDNGGQAVVLGTPRATGNDGSDHHVEKCVVRQFDGSRNATDSSVRLDDGMNEGYNVFIHGRGVTWDNGGSGGNGTRGSYLIAGRHIRLFNCRCVNAADSGASPILITAYSGFSTRDVHIDQFLPLGDPGDYDPLVLFSNNAETSINGVKLTLADATNVVSAFGGKENANSFEIEQPNTRVEIGDDDFATLEFTATAVCVISLVGNNSGARAATAHVGVGGNVFANELSSFGGNVVCTTGALDGTTGNDGDLTISAHSDNKVYIENRTGSARQYSVQLIGASEPIVLS